MKLPDIFDKESKSINLFNKKLAEMEKQTGWMEAGENITMINDSSGTPRNIIIEYGRLTVEYINENLQNFIGQQMRQSQNSVQVFHCLAKSMTEAAYLKIVEESSKYMYNETPVCELLFKLMMQKPNRKHAL